jgi:hypothetical protein
MIAPPLAGKTLGSANDSFAVAIHELQDRSPAALSEVFEKHDSSLVGSV